MRYILILLLSVTVTGCVSMAPRQDTVENMQSSKKKEQLFKSAVAVLASNGYMVKVSDPSTGIIVTEPKQYEVKRGVMGMSHPFKTSIQVTVADQQLTASYNHQCKYQDIKWGSNSLEDGQFAGCAANDSDFMKTVPAHEAKLKEMLSKIV